MLRFTLLFLISAHLSLNAQETLTPKRIIEKSYDTMKPLGTEAKSTMVIVDQHGNKRVRVFAQITKLLKDGDTQYKLVRFLSPADVKGTGFLTYDYEDKDDDMWLYMPALRKTRRIVSSEKAKSFMGSEFAYADIAPPTLNDFTYKALGEETLEGTPCYKIEFIPNNEEIIDENGFSKKISWVGKKDFVTRKSVYYDIDGEYHKEFYVREIKLVDPKMSRYRYMNMEMINKQNGRSSIFKTEKVIFNDNIDKEYFNSRNLENN